MKKPFLFMIAFIAFACFANAQNKPKTDATFELKDIYLQVGIGKPVHVMNAPVQKLTIRLGEDLRFWITVRLRDGVLSPCTPRDKEPCHLEFRIARKDADRSKLDYSDDEVRFKNSNDDAQINIAYPFGRDSTLGEKVLLYRVRFKDQILATFEAPLEVTE